ncbi:tyrosine-type recombinase/integrase [Psychromonas hadalis]|uniref:tyrosine-type recombinase/integrase n=1 Tax=Psychromonas hadalis TaxID=211669 RepID=UPI0003B381E8|nr:integrase [Psychromonas hadalis]
MIHPLELKNKAIENACCVDGVNTQYKFITLPYCRLFVGKNDVKKLKVCKYKNGRPKYVDIGIYPAIKVKDIERLANAIYQKLTGTDIAVLADEVIIDDYFNTVYLPYSRKTKKSWADDESRYRCHVKAVLGHMFISAVKTIHVASLINNLPERLSLETCDRIRSLLSAIFSSAERLELIERNPVKYVPAYNKCEIDKRILSTEETVAYMESAFVEANPNGDCFSHSALALILLLLTGMRVSNGINLTRKQISADCTQLLLTDTKQGKEQLIYLSEPAQWVVKTAMHMSCNQYLFPSPRKPDSPISYPRSTFVRICKRAGIAVRGNAGKGGEGFSSEPVRIHTLRKTFASTAIAAGVDVYTVSKLLGHGSVSVTEKHYAFVKSEILSSAVQNIGKSMIPQCLDLPLLGTTNS